MKKNDETSVISGLMDTGTGEVLTIGLVGARLGHGFGFASYSTDGGGPSMTRQDMADECDVNRIMAAYKASGASGTVPSTYARDPAAQKYIDFENPPDFQEAMQLMIDAELAFSKLPALVRKEFDNDPQKFVAYASGADGAAGPEGDRVEFLRKYGLAEPAPVEQPPQRVEIVNPAPPEPPAAK